MDDFAWQVVPFVGAWFTASVADSSFVRLLANAVPTPCTDGRTVVTTLEVRMAVAMEVRLNDPHYVDAGISGYGEAVAQTPMDADDLPALIAVRLRWHRRFRKDRSLDYDEKELKPSQIVHLDVGYALKPGERKTAFVEIINKRTGQKLKSNRALFEGQPLLP